MDAAAAGPHLACLFCTQNCYRTHGEGKPLGRTIPMFCKILTESAVAKRSDCSFLELPSTFVRAHGHELCRTVVLEGPSGQTWSVDVFRSGCIMKFKNGWRDFSFDHNLNEGDIVLFKLTTKAYFVVQVFDKDGCEKDLYSVQNSSAFAIQYGTSSSKQCKKRIHPPKNLCERMNKHLELEKVANTCSLVSGDLIMEREKDAANHQEGITGGSSIPLTTLKLVIDADNYKRKTVIGRKHIHELNREGSKKRSVKETNLCLRIVPDAMAAAKSHKSSNPTVIIKMIYSHVSSSFLLSLGKNFTKEWMPLANRDAILVNSAGCRWKVKYLWRRGAFSAGWRRFSIDHGLQVRDVCLFELTRKKQLELVVHMFRLCRSNYGSF